MIPAMWWPAIAAVLAVAAVAWASAAIVLGVRCDRLQRRIGL